MLKPLLVATLLSLSSTAAMAQMTPLAEMPSGKYALDKTHASVTWKVSHLGLSNYTARFAKMDATLEFDAKDPTKSKLVASVDPLSIKTDYPNAAQKDFDKELSTGKDWFNANKFPDIKFESTKVEKTGENTGKVHGNLTMLGVTKPLVLDAKFNGAYLKKPFADVPGLGFSATATLKRSDWGFSTYVPNIGDEVQILIETEFHKAQ